MMFGWRSLAAARPAPETLIKVDVARDWGLSPDGDGIARSGIVPAYTTRTDRADELLDAILHYRARGALRHYANLHG